MTMQTEVPLVFDDVRAGYSKANVLDGLTLEVAAGSVCALLGRNGAGKTTLLRTALGFLKIRGGRVMALGEDAWQGRFDLKDRIGFVAERQDLWPRMRGAELLALAARLFRSWDSGQAASLVDRYGLDLDKPMGTYSKGMQVQIAQIVALSHRPELLILDEPVAGMDPVVRSEFTEHVLRHVHDTGATVLYSTHLVSEVEDMADRVAFLHGGTIVLAGEVQEILSRYTRVVAILGAEGEDQLAALAPVSVHRREEVAVVTIAGEVDRVAAAIRTIRLDVLDMRRPTLQELFIGLLGEDNLLRNGSHAARRVEEAT